MNKFKNFHVLSEELESYLKYLQGLYQDSVLGYKLIANAIEQRSALLKEIITDDDEITSQEFQDTTIFDHEQFYRDYMSGAGLFFHKEGEVRKRVNGSNQYQIGVLVVATLYSYWEQDFRKKVAQAYRQKKYNHDLWGDLRLLRNAVIHPCENALNELRDKAKFMGKFIQNGQINLSPQTMRLIFMCVYAFKNELFKESLPKSSFKIPVNKDC